MSLPLPVHLAANYRRASQVARVTTEAWASLNLFCPNCGSALTACPANTKTKDFDCSACGEPFQLKSMTKSFKGLLLGAEYKTTLNYLNKGSHPSLILLRYAPTSMTVQDVQVIHRACITASCLVPRKPLSVTARRAGWQGCNFLLDQIPVTARVDIARSGLMLPRALVLQQWQTVQSFLTQPVGARGWTADVLRIVEKLSSQFTLSDVYIHESELAVLHPENSNVQPKIRQQLQILRDTGLILFLGGGRYMKAIPAAA